MFDLGLGFGEILLLAVVGLIIIGPKDLPFVLYKAGQWIGKLRIMANDVQSSFKQAMHQEEITRLKNELEQMKTGDMSLIAPPVSKPTDSVFADKMDDKKSE